MKESGKGSLSVFWAVLAAALYAVNAPVAKLLLEDVEPAMMAGLLYLGAGAGMLLLGILSSVFPCVYSISSAGVEWTRVYTGLWGFLKTNHLEWLFALCGALLLAGTAVLCSPVLKRLRDRRASSPAPDQ